LGISEATLATRKPSPHKHEALRKHGCLNPRPESVIDERFVATDFFDPYDLLQVKYEMVRRVRIDRLRVSDTARSFGFSRPTVYQALSAFELGGLAALLPQKPGPRRAHKLSVEVVDYLERRLTDEPELTPADLAVALRERFGLSVHPRSIERTFKRREKKRH
jgi:transposase